MKGEIAAYITALINNHQRYLDKLNKELPSSVSISNQQIIVDELTDLLDFVEDISENREFKEENNEN